MTAESLTIIDGNKKKLAAALNSALNKHSELCKNSTINRRQHLQKRLMI
jgi:hypothetical protein